MQITENQTVQSSFIGTYQAGKEMVKWESPWSFANYVHQIDFKEMYPVRGCHQLSFLTFFSSLIIWMSFCSQFRDTGRNILQSFLCPLRIKLIMSSLLVRGFVHISQKQHMDTHSSTVVNTVGVCMYWDKSNS